MFRQNNGVFGMRVVTILAAIAALWAMPAQAVTLFLTSPYSETGAHQKVTLTGLTGADTVTVTGDLGNLTYHYWFDQGSSWLLDGQDVGGVFNCTTTTHCDNSFVWPSDVYPVSATALLSIDIVGNDIFVDWAKSGGDVCGALSEAERVSGAQHKCGFNWRNDRLFLDINVQGPSAQTFGYSVSSYNPVPEPASWALMILGIGLAGAAMRRRHTPSVPSIRQASPM